MKDNEMIRRIGALQRLALTCLVTVAVLGDGGLVAVAHAQTVDAPAGVARSEIGHATLAWLDMQRSNSQAAPPQPMLGEEAGLAYRRYMESFKSKIPDLYGSAVNQGSGGQSSGTAGQLPQN
ncbi:hypothetical protein R69658_06044 [Paraburkholderia aspalathi]|jgi:hypothetical protein|uniref:DUF3613 domain-containing protein n=1 Tax=Paraburkholderia aspalathi TaxID=1324617 RepID=A0ABN7MZR8_9BURK|nr:DUF3613 domain-containing protein [Paraburkholderia aspalathi]CAE6825430.1 hypothetical protein R69658_06044 [Paraburkholderia aspalathi]